MDGKVKRKYWKDSIGQRSECNISTLVHDAEDRDWQKTEFTEAPSGEIQNDGKVHHKMVV